MKKLFFAVLPCLATPVIQEVLADPYGLSDSDAEYVEIANLGPGAWDDSLSIQIGTKIYALGKINLASQGYLVLGPDSLQGLIAPQSQLIHPGSWSLSNSAELPMLLLGPQSRILDSVLVPKAKSGKAWIRQDTTWQNPSTLCSWGDLGNPGWSGDTTQSAQVHIKNMLCSADSVILELERTGTGNWKWQATWDSDFDPSSVDSLQGIWTDSWRLGLKGNFGQLKIVWGEGSPLPGQNFSQSLLCPGSGPRLSEIHPAPSQGQSEWLELHQTSPFAMDLCALTWQSQNSSGHFCTDHKLLQAGHYSVFAYDSSAFRHSYGPLRIDLHKSAQWPGLGNEGGMLKILGPDQVLIDSLSYGSTNYDRSQSLQDSIWNPDTRPSPGFSRPADLTQALQIPKQIHQGQILYLWDRSYQARSLELFEMRGSRVDAWECPSGTLCGQSSAHWPLGTLLLKTLNSGEEPCPIQVLP